MRECMEIIKRSENVIGIGNASNDVKIVQIMLNRISRNFVQIPKIPQTDGVFGYSTEIAIREIQKIFSLEVNGSIDKITWDKIDSLYGEMIKISELNGNIANLSKSIDEPSEMLSVGNNGTEVKRLQSQLALLGCYWDKIEILDSTGHYDKRTEASVKSFQFEMGIDVTGSVDKITKNEMYKAYNGIQNTIMNSDGADIRPFPQKILKEGITNNYVRTIQKYLSYIHESYPNIPEVSMASYFGPLTKNAVISFQRQFNLNANGVVGEKTWNKIAEVYSALKYGYKKLPYQFPGYVMRKL